ncbi:MAG TPA: hypothetical protein VMH28_24910 [Candidatus Acidoferrales bacterium]|nr:hypothetical protein [Bryobacteraceae bacterium]HTS65295.1 hypothetical protein [Candidatus Acidoferrales bacterium]
MKLRGPAVSRVLGSLGIDAPRYWLLLDLFTELAERREILNQLGRDGITLKVSSWMFLVVGGLACLGFLRSPPSAATFLGAFTLITVMMLGCILISEAGNSLVNPVEGLVLAHQPVDGATYTAAKLTHLARVVGFLAPALNAIPAFASLALLKRPFWYYPPLHLAATYSAGLLTGFFACALFGFLLRFIPASRLKSVAQIVEMLPFLAMMFAGQIWRWVVLRIGGWLPAGSAGRRYFAIGLPVAAAATLIMGIRSLSADYLIRVSNLAHGGGGGRAAARRSRVADVVARWLGGPPARAGFAYTARLMRRDWAFRRQLIGILPLLISMGVMLAQGGTADPFAGRFSAVHVMPHVFGVALFLVAISIIHGEDYKGAWVFLLAPASAFDAFARGVYGLLWFSIVGVPHAILLAVLAWFWPVSHVLLWLAYSLAVSSLYLGLVLRLIDGIPFSKQPVTSRGAYFMGIMIGGGLAIAAAVGLQYYLVFRSVMLAAGVTAVLWGLVWLVTRSSLEAFAVAMRFNLGLASAETGAIYTEVDA